LTAIVNTLGLEENQPIEHRILSGVIENAQKRVEGKNFSIRKNVLQYDDVMNQQRELIYKQRREVLEGKNLKDYYRKMLEKIVENIITTFCGESQLPDYWDWDSMIAYAESIFLPKGYLDDYRKDLEQVSVDELKEKMIDIAWLRYLEKEQEFTEDIMRQAEREILLRVVDNKWMDHIDAMDQLRYGIGLRAYGQRDPVIEYKFEGFAMFEEMIKSIQEDAFKIILHAQIQKNRNILKREVAVEPVAAIHGDAPRKPKVASKDRVGRNEPCPCGSGKKYKKCCGM